MPTECTKCGNPLEAPGFMCPGCEGLQNVVFTLKQQVTTFVGKTKNDDVSDANGEEPES